MIEVRASARCDLLSEIVTANKRRRRRVAMVDLIKLKASS
jgi:hypothetical protein